MNYFEEYSIDEIPIINEWIDTIDGLRDNVISVEADNTSHHDVMVTLRDIDNLNDGEPIALSIEVEQEEEYWYRRTGRITIDAISAFKYKDKAHADRLMRRGWVHASDLREFLACIDVKAYGKIKMCDANIQIKKIRDTDFLVGYDNMKLVNNRGYIERNFDLRINNKQRYGLTDNWESATYCLQPSVLDFCTIRTINDVYATFRPVEK